MSYRVILDNEAVGVREFGPYRWHTARGVAARAVGATKTRTATVVGEGYGDVLLVEAER